MYFYLKMGWKTSRDLEISRTIHDEHVLEAVRQCPSQLVADLDRQMNIRYENAFLGNVSFNVLEHSPIQYQSL
jgi:hypothetical protein